MSENPIKIKPVKSVEYNPRDIQIRAISPIKPTTPISGTLVDKLPVSKTFKNVEITITGKSISDSLVHLDLAHLLKFPEAEKNGLLYSVDTSHRLHPIHKFNHHSCVVSIKTDDEDSLDGKIYVPNNKSRMVKSLPKWSYRALNFSNGVSDFEKLILPLHNSICIRVKPKSNFKIIVTYELYEEAVDENLLEVMKIKTKKERVEFLRKKYAFGDDSSYVHDLDLKGLEELDEYYKKEFPEQEADFEKVAKGESIAIPQEDYGLYINFTSQQIEINENIELKLTGNILAPPKLVQDYIHNESLIDGFFAWSGSKLVLQIKAFNSKKTTSRVLATHSKPVSDFNLAKTFFNLSEVLLLSKDEIIEFHFALFDSDNQSKSEDIGFVSEVDVEIVRILKSPPFKHDELSSPISKNKKSSIWQKKWFQILIVAFGALAILMVFKTLKRRR